MTATKTPAADRIAGDVRQLTHPIHVALRGRIVTHDPLLEQLREAAVPSSGAGVVRRPPGSRPPASLDALDRLSGIYVGISGWHARLCLPSPARHLDWQMAVLDVLAERARDLAPAVAEWLAVEVHGWWHDAAVGSGWKPTDLLKLR